MHLYVPKCKYSLVSFHSIIFSGSAAAVISGVSVLAESAVAPRTSAWTSVWLMIRTDWSEVTEVSIAVLSSIMMLEEGSSSCESFVWSSVDISVISIGAKMGTGWACWMNWYCCCCCCGWADWMMCCWNCWRCWTDWTDWFCWTLTMCWTVDWDDWCVVWICGGGCGWTATATGCDGWDAETIAICLTGMPASSKVFFLSVCFSWVLNIRWDILEAIMQIF